MRNHLKKLLVIIAVIAITAGTYLYTHVSHSFVLHVTSDGTSSGGSRFTESTVVVKNKMITSGTLTYTASSQGGESFESCVIVDGQWQQETGDACMISPIIPLDYDAIRADLKSGAMMPKDQCTHRGRCYEFLD